ncbi:unnamed protein product [Linum tenue]|uniref:Uncharacterized protein n=1 Tax=Linum tenue TaxID=586396 RepID=A0AAV0I9N4_9ROSI|nr:unnamed protein product [Linum tenue]
MGGYILKVCLAAQNQVVAKTKHLYGDEIWGIVSLCSLFLFLDACYIFVLGGTSADNGNNNCLNTTAKYNVPFNGIDYRNSTPTGRASNGLILPDYVGAHVSLCLVIFLSAAFLLLGEFSYVILPARRLNRTESPRPIICLIRSSDEYKRAILTEGGTLASASSGIFDTTGRPRFGEVIQVLPLRTQVKFFGEVYEDLIDLQGRQAAASLIRRSLFIVSTGSSDIADQLDRHPISDSFFITAVIAQYVGLLRSLYAYEARKFAIVAPLLIGCNPSSRAENATGGGRCNQRGTSLTLDFVESLATALRRLRVLYPDFQYSICNAPNFLLDVNANPGSFPACGISEVRDACCGNGTMPCRPTSTLCGNREQYLYWNQYQLTQEGSRILTAACFSSNLRYAAPINFYQLARTTT